MKSTKPSEPKPSPNQLPQIGDLTEFKLHNQIYVERVVEIHANQTETKIKVERPNGTIDLYDYEILKIHPRKSAAQEISRLREMANNLQDLYDDICCAAKHDVLACCDEIIKQANSIKDRVF